MRRARPSPHWSGWVIPKQASDVFGHAHWCEPELQVPQAPCPALPQGPQELPQQNQDISPYAGEPLLEQPILCLRSFVPT
ncbi:hypothetical protein GCM10010151_34940 [Actinoallomurus spadix]|uniref:Uncharacterized protein n=1 Tax=Actinoallomurus spadix TaxID=79912 RepID=A0ABN0WN37_9ACTN